MEEAASTSARQQSFEELRRFLAVHETAEEQEEFTLLRKAGPLASVLDRTRDAVRAALNG